MIGKNRLTILIAVTVIIIGSVLYGTVISSQGTNNVRGSVVLPMPPSPTPLPLSRSPPATPPASPTFPPVPLRVAPQVAVHDRVPPVHFNERFRGVLTVLDNREKEQTKEVQLISTLHDPPLTDDQLQRQNDRLLVSLVSSLARSLADARSTDRVDKWITLDGHVADEVGVDKEDVTAQEEVPVDEQVQNVPVDKPRHHKAKGKPKHEHVAEHRDDDGDGDDDDDDDGDDDDDTSDMGESVEVVLPSESPDSKEQAAAEAARKEAANLFAPPAGTTAPPPPPLSDEAAELTRLRQGSPATTDAQFAADLADPTSRLSLTLAPYVEAKYRRARPDEALTDVLLTVGSERLLNLVGASYPACTSFSISLGQSLASCANHSTNAIAICGRRCGDACIMGYVQGRLVAALDEEDATRRAASSTDVASMWRTAVTHVRDVCSLPEARRLLRPSRCAFVVGTAIASTSLAFGAPQADGPLPFLIDRLCLDVFPPSANLPAADACCGGVYHKALLGDETPFGVLGPASPSLEPVDLKVLAPPPSVVPCDATLSPAWCFFAATVRLHQSWNNLLHYCIEESLDLSFGEHDGGRPDDGEVVRVTDRRISRGRRHRDNTKRGDTDDRVALELIGSDLAFVTSLSHPHSVIDALSTDEDVSLSDFSDASTTPSAPLSSLSHLPHELSSLLHTADGTTAAHSATDAQHSSSHTHLVSVHAKTYHSCIRGIAATSGTVSFRRKKMGADCGLFGDETDAHAVCIAGWAGAVGERERERQAGVDGGWLAPDEAGEQSAYTVDELCDSVTPTLHRHAAAGDPSESSSHYLADAVACAEAGSKGLFGESREVLAFWQGPLE